MLEKIAASTLLNLNNLSLFYGQKSILSEINFELKAGEIVGVVGKNGTGKSSMLKLIAKNIEPDSGKIDFKKGTTISYLDQESEFETDLTIFEELAKKWLEFQQKYITQNLVYLSDIINLQNPWQNLNQINQGFVIEKINKLLLELEFYDGTTIVKNLSGGEKRKLAIACCFIVEPNVLVLDEPTNHLDILGVELLEKLLKNFSGGVVLVSHDRYFLDKITTRIVEIFDGQIYNHPGNYKVYLDSKSVREEIANIAQSRKQGFLKKELNWVNAGVKARGTKDKGRLDRFYNLKNEKKNLVEETVDLILPPAAVMGNKIINFENVTIENHAKIIIKDFNFNFHRNTKLGIIGNNGTGKTSIIKAIMEQIKCTKGRIAVGMGTKINYQDQQKLNLDPEKTPFLEISQGQERTNFGETTVSARKYLKRFLFDSQQILTPIKFLSGGEKSRLMLAKILKEGGNCLILDEPTNDLDLETINLLEQAILEFTGVVLVVSHDRYFLNKVCNNILALNGNGNYDLVLGNYNQYLAKIKPQLSNLDIVVKVKNPFKIDKKEQRTKELKIKNVEKQIAVLEDKIKAVENEFSQPDFFVKNPNGYGKRISHLSDLKRQLEKVMGEWEELG